ncbi:MAG: DNA integrity scanning protein DisA nucleotide-binding domain protein, partial [Clostridia bacterium]|nr:DNA integrity scanning protein DisA nucleotide-binding domain protein [Clostridia bacterium]
SRDLGTRHRAGLGVSESTDAVVLIVSEETGIISMARGGRLTRYLDADSLRKILSEMYHEDHSRLWQWTHRARAAKGGTANDE